MFSVAFSALFADALHEDHLNLIANRVDNANFNELLYADDTVLISTSAPALSRYVRELELAGAIYGLALNKAKTHHMSFNDRQPVRYADQSIIQKTHCAEYLGVLIDRSHDISTELSHRLRKAGAAWKATELLWAKANVSNRMKIQVYNSIINAMVLYGLESAQLCSAHLARLTAFQLRGLRKILRISTTFIDRSHTNAFVFRRATAAFTRDLSHIRRVIPVGEVYGSRRLKLMADLVRLPESNPRRATTLVGSGISPYRNLVRRVGRPKHLWANHALQDAWHATRSSRVCADPIYDPLNAEHRGDLKLGIWLHDSL